MMDTIDKVNILSKEARYDLCSSYLCQGKEASRKRDAQGRWIYPAAMPNGKTILLFKVLMTSACDNDCLYCALRCSRDVPRTGFKPEELAQTFMELYQHRIAEGLFLSSAVAGSSSAMMERMIKAVEIIRFKYRFTGYIHLKILPGASFDYVERAMNLSDRVSVNLEAPNPERLKMISGRKNFEEDLLKRMRWIKSLADQRGKKAKHTTQFVVGAAGESDKEILETTTKLYKEVEISRAYFSAFQPLEGTPLQDHPPTSPAREHRLYQADFLFRDYGFKFDDLIFDGEGNLPLDADPKLIWAFNNPAFFPLEVNKAGKEELLRVPGLGPKSVSRILKMRAKERFHSLNELKGTGAVIKRATPFILINGRSYERPVQLSFMNDFTRA